MKKTDKNFHINFLPLYFVVLVMLIMAFTQPAQEFNMHVLPCSTCFKTVDLNTVKYHTGDQKHVFCGAQCSLDWFTKEKNKTHKGSMGTDRNPPSGTV